jgi:hypothetical protein
MIMTKILRRYNDDRKLSAKTATRKEIKNDMNKNGRRS